MVFTQSLLGRRIPNRKPRFWLFGKKCEIGTFRPALKTGRVSRSHPWLTGNQSHHWRDKSDAFLNAAPHAGTLEAGLHADMVSTAQKRKGFRG
jgi:hypothetical protein